VGEWNGGQMGGVVKRIYAMDALMSRLQFQHEL